MTDIVQKLWGFCDTRDAPMACRAFKRKLAQWLREVNEAVPA